MQSTYRDLEKKLKVFMTKKRLTAKSFVMTISMLLIIACHQWIAEARSFVMDWFLKSRGGGTFKLVLKDHYHLRVYTTFSR